MKTLPIELRKTKTELNISVLWNALNMPVFLFGRQIRGNRPNRSVSTTYRKSTKFLCDSNLHCRLSEKLKKVSSSVLEGPTLRLGFCDFKKKTPFELISKFEIAGKAVFLWRFVKAIWILQIESPSKLIGVQTDSHSALSASKNHLLVCGM